MSEAIPANVLPVPPPGPAPAAPGPAEPTDERLEQLASIAAERPEPKKKQKDKRKKGSDAADGQGDAVKAEKVPFWKKELSLGGSKSKGKAKPEATATPGASPEATGSAAVAPTKPAKESRAERNVRLKTEKLAKKDAKAQAGADKKAAKAQAATAKKTAKKSKSGKAKSPVEVDPVSTAAVAAAKKPFLKRELKLGRKKTAAAAAAVAVQVGEETAAEADGAEPAVEPAAEPKGGRGRKGAAKTKAPKAAKSKAPGSSRGKRGSGKTIVGVKVGASGISVAHVENDGGAEVVQIVRETLPRGVIVGGELRDPEMLAARLKEVFQKHHLPRRAVRLGVSNNRIGVRIIEVAGVMDSKQLENAIRFRAQEVLPITLDDAVLDYQTLSETVNAEGELVRRILLVVAYRDLVDRYIHAFKIANVRLVGIDLEAFGLLRALIPPAASDQRAEAAHVVVSIGHERSTFAVSDGLICEFTRVLDWGGNVLDTAIARQLNMTPSEAEPIKFAVSLDDKERPLPAGMTEEQMTLVADIVRRQLQTFARELVSSLQFYQNQPGSLGIGDIVIAGGTAQLPGLANELQRLIGVSVRLGDPFAQVKVSKRIREPEQHRAAAVAVGLGIER